MDCNSPAYHSATLCFCEDAIHIDVTISGFYSAGEAEIFVKPSWRLVSTEEALFFCLGKNNDDVLHFKLEERQALLRVDKKASQRTHLDPSADGAMDLIMAALEDCEAGIDNPLNTLEEDLEPVVKWSFAGLHKAVGGKKGVGLSIDQYLAYGVQQADPGTKLDTDFIEAWRISTYNCKTDKQQYIVYPSAKVSVGEELYMSAVKALEGIPSVFFNGDTILVPESEAVAIEMLRRDFDATVDCGHGQEGEFATKAQAAGVDERIIRMGNAILRGIEISPDQMVQEALADPNTFDRWWAIYRDSMET
jgi:hypothetical protein